MSSTAFETKRIGPTPDVIATDGCEVRVLCATSRGGMALFTLAASMVGKAVAHRTVEALQVVVRGRGRMWRKSGEREEIAELAAGVSVSIPTGTHFQLRSDGAEPLEAVAVTMPPWPGDGEAYIVAGKWVPDGLMRCIFGGDMALPYPSISTSKSAMRRRGATISRRGCPSLKSAFGPTPERWRISNISPSSVPISTSFPICRI